MCLLDYHTGKFSDQRFVEYPWKIPVIFMQTSHEDSGSALGRLY